MIIIIIISSIAALCCAPQFHLFLAVAAVGAEGFRGAGVSAVLG
jgi:hypothetical protein